MTPTEEQLNLRQQVLQILFKKFGKGDYSNKSIYECADEWVAKGHKICLLYTSPSPRDLSTSRMPSSA